MKKNIKDNYLKNESGSVLVFTLFIMMISLIIGMSLMTTSTVGRKSTLSSAKSTNAFQVADSGIEYATRKIRKERWDEADANHALEGDENLRDVFGNTDCAVESGNAVVTGNVNGGEYKLYFFRGPGGSTQMNTCTAASSTIENITKIKSIGVYNGITRSVEIDMDLSSL